MKLAAPLTEYATRFRYPGEPDDPTKDEAEAALNLAKSVYRALCEALPNEARPVEQGQLDF